MVEKEYSREGELIYKEGKIEVRNFPNGENEHNVYIGKHYFLFQRGVLEEIALRSSSENLVTKLNAYNPIIPVILEQNNISPAEFALTLARAKIIDSEKYVDYSMNNLCRII